MPSATGIYGGEKLEAAMLEHSREYPLTIREIAERQFEDGRRKLELSFDETDKTFVLNKTNCKEIASQLGDDYANWSGRRISVYRTCVDFRGASVDAIRIGQPVVRSDTAPQISPAEHQQRAENFAEAAATTPPEGPDSIPF